MAPTRTQLGCNGRGWHNATAPVRRAWALAHRPCALCGRAIDYTLPARQRGSLTVDHIIPLWAGGPALDPTNWQPAHHACNASRGAREGNLRRQRRTRLAW